jgi:hypothetical protein
VTKTVASSLTLWIDQRSFSPLRYIEEAAEIAHAAQGTHVRREPGVRGGVDSNQPDLRNVTSPPLAFADSDCVVSLLSPDARKVYEPRTIVSMAMIVWRSIWTRLFGGFGVYRKTPTDSPRLRFMNLKMAAISGSNDRRRSAASP